MRFDLEKFKAGMKAKWGKQLIKYTYTATNGFICFEFEAGDPSYSALEHLIKAATMVSRHQALIDAYDPEDTWQVHTKQSGIWVTIKEPTWDEDYEWRLHPHNDLIKAYKKGAEIECKHKDKEWRDASSDDIRAWYEEAEYRIKPEPEFTYPIYKKHIDDTGLIVKFLSMTEGEIVENGKTGYIVGQLHNDWWVHTDASVWQDWTPITKSKPTIHCLAYDAKRFDHEQTTAVRARVVKKEVAQANGWTIIKEWEV